MDQLSYTKYLDFKKDLQKKLVEFLDDETNNEHLFAKLIKLVDDQKLLENKPELDLFFMLITTIANDHYRSANFFDKIFQILNYLKSAFKQTYLNSEIFKIFKSNKRILLFLIQNGYLNIDQSIVRKMTTQKFINNGYDKYFAPELKPFIMTNQTIEQSDNFMQNREIGLNETKICELIRNDSIDDFITFINQTNISLSTNIENSIFETNSFLIKKKNTSLIQYAAFYGSIQIFNYLKINKVDIDSSIWFYAIHGKNSEIIDYIENNIDKPNADCLIESIKCHNNELANYLFKNYLNETDFLVTFMKF